LSPNFANKSLKLFSHPILGQMPKKPQNGANGANGESVEGNTKTSTDSLEKRPTQQIWWCFTLPNWTEEEYEKWSQWSQRFCKKWVVGKEIGPNSGTPHLQGTFALKTKRRFTELKKHLGSRYHLEPCKYPVDAMIYCAKDGNYSSHGVMGWELSGDDLPQGNVADELIKDLRPWQQSIVDLLKQKPDQRTIHWIYETVGGVGKSDFSNYCIYHFNTLVVEKGKYSDIMNAAFNTENLRSFIIDAPRSSKNYVSYDALESIKNGRIVNHKYEYGQLLIPKPHVIVFANYPPDFAKLSRDRWKLYTIGKDLILEELDIPSDVWADDPLEII